MNRDAEKARKQRRAPPPAPAVKNFLRLTGRACRCRPGAAALAGSGSVRRRERPGPASLDCSRLAPLLAGPRRASAARAAPATTSAAPRSAPRRRALNANDCILRKTNTFPSSDGAPARLVGRAPSSTIRTHLARTAQPPVALAGAVTLPFPASFWPRSSRIGLLTEIRGTEPQWADSSSGLCSFATWHVCSWAGRYGPRHERAVTSPNLVQSISLH